MLEALLSLLILAGAIFTFISSLGLARLPDFFTRLHAPTKATTLGVGCLLVASAIHFSTQGEGLSLHEVVRAQHDGPPSAPRHDAHRLVELLGRRRVESRGGLVEKEQIRVVDECACEGQALLHPAAEPTDTLVRPVGDAEFGEQCLRARNHVGGGDVVHLGEGAQRLARRQAVVERR